MRCLSEILHGVYGYAAGIREGGRAQVALCRVPVLTARKGISSVQLSKELGVTQNTAWYMLHRLRCWSRVCTCGRGRSRRSVYRWQGDKPACQQEEGTGEWTGWQATVIGLRERGGRFEAKAIEAADKPIVQGMIKEYVETGSTVYTDDHRSYSGLAKKDYRHKSVKHSADKYAREVVHTNGIESVWCGA